MLSKRKKEIGKDQNENQKNRKAREKKIETNSWPLKNL